MSEKIRLAIFASGSGSNAENIAKYFSQHLHIEIAAVFCNKPSAYVLERAKNLGIPAVIFNRSDFYDSAVVAEKLKSMSVDFVVLAGFLWLIPAYLVKMYPGKIVNIHPALLPKYGGKGMYGMFVHEAVSMSGDTETGITIHFVNENYDEGAVIFQAKTAIAPHEKPESISEKIHELEYLHFPEEIEKTIHKIFS